MVPDDFTLGLALTDSLPVIFFGISMLLISHIFGSKLFFAGALLSFLGGAGKVLWKVIVVLRKKNIWPLFIQMRITMPIGFALMILAVILNRKMIDLTGIWQAVISFPSIIFFAIGVLGMILMMIFTFALDNADPKANWIEQITNAVSQGGFLIGILFLL